MNGFVLAAVGLIGFDAIDLPAAAAGPLPDAPTAAGATEFSPPRRERTRVLLVPTARFRRTARFGSDAPSGISMPKISDRLPASRTFAAAAPFFVGRKPVSAFAMRSC